MFEIGKDICRFCYIRENVAGGYKVRLRVIHIIILGLFCLFAVWTLVLGIQGNAKQKSYTQNNLAERAEIFDRNGEVLAKNVISGHIMLRPVAVDDIDTTAQIIHKAIPEYSVNDAINFINAGKFVYLKKYANDVQLDIVKKAKLPGLEIEPTYMRHYPKGRRFSHIIGFVGRDGYGLEGAERVYDKYLSENKDPLYLSIDAHVQEQFYTQLTIAMQEYQAKAAMGMLMNSRTGEIIAMVSLPDYNPSNIGADPVVNRKFKPMRDILEMGSIFKIFNTAMAYEQKINKLYYIKKPYPLYTKRGKYVATISDVSSFKPTKPYFNIDEIMIHSCNVGSAQIALDLPDGTQKEFFERLHFNQPLDLEFGRTERPQMPRQWEITEKATVAIGHGISVTPMHAFLAVNAMTNGGFYIYPTLKKRNVGRVVGERVLDSEISAKLRDNMRHVASDTSGKSAQSKIAGINIGGKTGTAEKRLPNGKTDKTRNVTTFISVFPVEAPQYISLVTLDEPKATKESWGWKTAAWNAVPVTGKILDGIIPLLFE